MRAAALGAVVALAACAPQSGPSPTVARNEVVARTFVSAWEAGNADAITDLFRPGAWYDDFANQMQYRGIQEIVGYVTSVQRWATGLSIDVGEVHASETGAVIEWVFSGIQERPIEGLAPVATGNDVVLNGVTILEIEDGRIGRAADYFDALPLLLQLGGEMRMPGGAVIRLEDLVPPDSSGGGG